jgi:hypothetical protein
VFDSNIRGLRNFERIGSYISIALLSASNEQVVRNAMQERKEQQNSFPIAQILAKLALDT